MWLINSTDLEYNINGYQYRTYLEVEDDNQKLFHLCFKDGQQVEMPYAFTNHSPYSKVSKEEFLGYIRGLEFNEQIPF
jgi:hypothetical protein